MSRSCRLASAIAGGLQEYTYYYQKGYRQVTGKPYTLKQRPQQRMAA
ncbi:MAG: hypothetical protein JOZ19_11565 [Rubrobacter sp.]|nr:hypothetical protein [Rubrobacter sp.]